MDMLIPLGKSRYATVDEEDFIELIQYRWHYMNGYAARRPFIDGKICGIVYMHRAIMNPPGYLVVDHIDGDRLNNTRANLRVCTHSENWKNRRVNSNSGTGVRGVFAKNGAFYVEVKNKGVRHNIGTFDTLEEAAEIAEDARKRILAGENYVRRDGKGSINPGLPQGSEVWTAKLKESDIPVILSRLKRGDMIKTIAADYGVRRHRITEIKKGTAWVHVPRE